MNKARYKTLLYIVGLWLVFTLVSPGCGDTFDALPDGSTITINPESASFNNITSDTIQNFTIVARYPDETPIPYALIKVHGPFAIPNSMGLYQFYYYPNGTQTLGNLTVDSGFKVQTDASGTYTFSVVVFATSLFKETIYVESGTVSATAVLEVTAD